MIFRKIKGVHLDGHKEMSIQSEIKDYLNPEFIYLPLNTGNVIYNATVKVGDPVLKGQIVANREGRFGHPVCSPISGTVKSLKKMWHPIGKMVEMIEIANDYKELAVEGYGIKTSDCDNLTKEQIVEKVKAAGVVGLGGAGFPTFVKYLPNNEMDVVLINAAECEPYITADYQSIKSNVQKMLRGTVYIMKATGAKRAIIAVKKNKKTIIDILNSALPAFTGISLGLLKDVYPAGWEKYIVETMINKTYNSLPSEVGAVVNNVQTAIAVCEAVEENKPLIEKVFTLTGEGIAEPANIRVKIGTLVSSLLPFVDGYKGDLGDGYFIAGGPMTGKSIMFDDLVITASLGSVIVKYNNNKVDNPECMGCGKCAVNCPAHLTPTEIRKAYELNDVEILKALNTTKCVQCGLCSYVCPSRVEMTEFVSKAKDVVAKANAMKK